MNLVEARESLIQQLKATGARVYGDPGAVIQPPGIVVSVPSLSWGGTLVTPREAEFTVTYSVKMDDRAAVRLLEAVSKVSEAITDPDFIITSATPGIYTSNGVDLPSYSFTIATTLS